VRGAAAAVSHLVSAIIAPLFSVLAGVLLGLMAADEAARSSPEQSMMAGIMPRHPTDDRTL
jgi:ABC-type proline/glycine betaine transport system permease subunit